MSADVDALHRREEPSKSLPHRVRSLNERAEWTFESHIRMKRRGADILSRQGTQVRINRADHFFAHLWPPNVLFYRVRRLRCWRNVRIRVVVEGCLVLRILDAGSPLRSRG